MRLSEKQEVELYTYLIIKHWRPYNTYEENRKEIDEIFFNDEDEYENMEEKKAEMYREFIYLLKKKCKFLKSIADHGMCETSKETIIEYNHDVGEDIDVFLSAFEMSAKKGYIQIEQWLQEKGDKVYYDANERQYDKSQIREWTVQTLEEFTTDCA